MAIDGAAWQAFVWCMNSRTEHCARGALRFRRFSHKYVIELLWLIKTEPLNNSVILCTGTVFYVEVR